MSDNEQHDGATYQLRRLTDRWVQPMGAEVISTHDSEHAAMAAYDGQPQQGDDGGGRSSAGSFVPTVVVRVGTDGSESVTVRRTGGGHW